MLVTAHTGRQNALHKAGLVADRLHAAGIAVQVLKSEAHELNLENAEQSDDISQAELIIVLGGDGTLLRGAELARPSGVPLIGVNLGHVGFLAEAEPDGLGDTVDRLVARQYVVEERMTGDRCPGSAATAWSARRRLAPPRTRSRPADRWSGPRWRHC
jgi:NAD+ kinase